MPRIRIEDLPDDPEVTPEELRRLMGGGLYPSRWLLLSDPNSPNAGAVATAGNMASGDFAVQRPI